MNHDLPEIVEEINDYGFPQTMQHDGRGRYFPVCSSCRACVMLNRGQGTICDQCDHEFMLHCEADFF